jgi:hypothetical protein
MSFDINFLNDLDDDTDYDHIEPLVEDYIENIVEQFAQSPEGQAHAINYPEIGSWITHFIDFGYKYEGFVLSLMTEDDMETMMEDLLPRKLVVADKAEAEEAVPELIAFWSFLEREYNFKNAKGIITYLLSIKDNFPDWMFDPARGGFAKNFFLHGMEGGFDMSSQEGMNMFKEIYNAQLEKKPLLPTPSTTKKSKAPSNKNKGFGVWTSTKSSRRKKK